MRFKESVARFFHLEKDNPNLQSEIILNNFFRNPEAVCYDFTNTPVAYHGKYKELIRDFNQRGRCVKLDFGADHMELGIPFTSASHIKNTDKEEFEGYIKRYGVTFNEGIYLADEILQSSLFIDDYGFEIYSYEDYVRISKQEHIQIKSKQSLIP